MANLIIYIHEISISWAEGSLQERDDLIFNNLIWNELKVQGNIWQSLLDNA